MSYCRLSDCDVYVYRDCDGNWWCSGSCAIADQQPFRSLTALKAHLDKHVVAGHDVDLEAFERIVWEQTHKRCAVSSEPIPEHQL